MANRYWVGGSGTWDSSTTTHWSASSGGAGGASVPTSADIVLLDANSGTGTITINTGYNPVINSLDFTGFTQTLAFGSQNISLVGLNRAILTCTSLYTVTGNPVINCTYSGSSGTRNINGTANQASALNIYITAGTDIIRFEAQCGTLDFTGFSGTLAASVSTKYIYGDLTLSTGMTISTGGAGIIFAAASGTQTITSNGKTIGSDVTIGNGVSTATVQLADDLKLYGTSTFYLNFGTFNANNKNVTANSFQTALTSTRTLTMGSGTWALSGNGSTWNTVPSGLTVNANTSTIQINDTGNTSSTFYFYGGGKTYYNLKFIGTGTSSSFSINDANTFNALQSTKTNAFTLNLPSGSTTTVANWNISGSSGNLVNVYGNNYGTQATLAYTGTGKVSSGYLSLRDSNATPANTWYAGHTSTNGLNNTGWLFVDFFSGSVSESLSSADSSSIVTSFVSAIKEGFTSSDVLLGGNSTFSNITENLVANDSDIVLKTYNTQITEPVSVTDSTSFFGFGTIDNTQNTVWVQVDNRQ